MIISYDKMNQLRHVRFLKKQGKACWRIWPKHRRRLVPCFDAVKTTFAQQLTPCGNIARWTNPKGGYFISLYVLPRMRTARGAAVQGVRPDADGRRCGLPLP